MRYWFVFAMMDFMGGFVHNSDLRSFEAFIRVAWFIMLDLLFMFVNYFVYMVNILVVSDIFLFFNYILIAMFGCNWLLFFLFILKTSSLPFSEFTHSLVVFLPSFIVFNRKIRVFFMLSSIKAIVINKFCFFMFLFIVITCSIKFCLFFFYTFNSFIEFLFLRN